jgi:peptidoglycan hydrolase-like protein with peptidoglycan-binding domain
MPFLNWLSDVPRAAGLKTADVNGWQTRGHGPMGDPKGTIGHHTAGSKTGNMPSLGTITKGRPDLAGPLCNYGLGRDGTVYVVAAGRAYHAGPGKWHGVTAGNSEMIGIEAENSGDGQPWPAVQIDAYVRLVAAAHKRIGADASMFCGHREWALPKGRKIDPTGIDLDAFRLQVAATMNGGIVRPPIPKADAQKRRTLRRGMSGDDVAALQKAIGVKSDGQFGSGTESALRAFQRAHGLVADGIGGPAVWAAIDGLKAAA